MKLPGYLILTILLFTLSQNAVPQGLIIDLYPEGEIPNFRATDETEKTDSSDVVRIRTVQTPNIKIYLPSKKIASGEAVIICPGGGYHILAYDLEGEDIAKYFNSKGIAAIILKYRLPVSKSQVVPYKSPLLDAQRAMRLVRYNAKKWNINPNMIGIMGFSAGGHLASTLSTHFDHGNSDSEDPVEQISCRPDFSLLIYPVISFTADYMHSGSQKALLGENADPELIKSFSNELQVTKETPPAILIHASDDTGVPVENSISYYQALIENGVRAEMHIYSYGKHGFGLAVGKGYLSGWPDRCVDFLKSLKP